MKPVVTAVALEYRDTFTFARLDVNTQPEKTVAYHIRGTPTYIVFKDGEMIDQFIGAMPSAKLVGNILGALGIAEAE
jgi:thioredoxin-like negative regulator of GroEL